MGFLPWDNFWQKWEGAPTTSQSLLLVFYVLLFGLGLGAAWHRNGWLGFLPLAVNLIYNLWTSIALLSGQRFLLAMDWSISLYYMIGLFVLLSVFLFTLERGRLVITIWRGVNTSQPDPQPPTGKWQSYLVAGVLFFAVGASLPLSEMVFPERYPPIEQAEALDKIMASGVWQDSGMDSACFEKTVIENRLTISQGRALYPRYYEAGGGEAFTDSFGYKIADEGRLVFQMLGQSNGRIVYPMSEPPEIFPNASDATLFYDTGGNLWFVFVEKDGVQRMYFSETLVPAVCE